MSEVRLEEHASPIKTPKQLITGINAGKTNPALSDIEIARAVACMANQSDASYKEPAANAAPAQVDAKGKAK
jgi:hypothetical protein